MAIRRLLAEHGVADYEIGMRGKHKACTVRHGGVERRFFYAATGSDRRGPLNLIALMRRELGLRQERDPDRGRDDAKRPSRAKRAGPRPPARPRGAPGPVGEDRFKGRLAAMASGMAEGKPT